MVDTDVEKWVNTNILLVYFFILSFFSFFRLDTCHYLEGFVSFSLAVTNVLMQNLS